MNYILFDDHSRNHLLPFTFLRPIADIRVGILTIREKWEMFLKAKTSTLTEGYLTPKYPIIQADINILINGSVLPNAELVEQIKSLSADQILVSDEIIIAMCVTANHMEALNLDCGGKTESIFTKNNFRKINNLWDLFALNDVFIADDFNLITAGRKSAPLSKTNQHIGQNLFIEKGAKVECAIINSTTGPVYIGENAEVMEACVIRGPFALCNNSQLKMGTKIYGATTIGPHSKVGGEISNSVFLGYSNKAHDGFLGNSVIGEWCNLGAGTNNSNLKNNYEEVKLWNYANKRFEFTGLQFCGLMMGDHSKCSIGTMFNTGTVLGINASVFGSGFHKNFVPSFTWGSPSNYTTYEFKKAMGVAQRVLERRHIRLSKEDYDILNHVYDLTLEFRYI